MNPQDNQTSFPRMINQQMVPNGEVKPRHLAATSTMAKGDLYYSDGTNFVRLAIGTVGQTLKVSAAGLPYWG